MTGVVQILNFMRSRIIVGFVTLLWVSVRLVGADAAKVPPPAEILPLLERAADWQLAHPAEKRPIDGWVQGAGYVGMMALADISGSARFHDAMMAMAGKNQWKPAKRPYHADDQCVTQTYLELYFRHRDPAMLGPTIERMDAILAHPMDDNLAFVGPQKNDRWAWCDSLFMAPPAWIRLWAATGKPAYLDFMVSNWWKTSAYLYDKDEHLYFRDSTFFAKREANGQKVFWSRGNGWVVGGLVRVLEYLPASHPARPKFEQQFKEMAARLIALQQADGFWRASLLDPASYPAKEASGTGFFCYGLAWGINQGLLDRATYLPATLKAWNALVSCVQPDGKVIHVQPIGADPKGFDENSTEPYGVGALLLAGGELYRMGVLDSAPSVTVTVRNASDQYRFLAPVELDRAALAKLGRGPLAVLDGRTTRVVPWFKAEGNASATERLCFRTDIAAGGTRTFQVVPAAALVAIPPGDAPTPPAGQSPAPLAVSIR
jgi:unsaturated rhamnogalacturonyl hydrolase